MKVLILLLKCFWGGGATTHFLFFFIERGVTILEFLLISQKELKICKKELIICVFLSIKDIYS